MIDDVDRGHKLASNFIRSGVRYWVQILQILHKGGASTVQITILPPTGVNTDFLASNINH